MRKKLVALMMAFTLMISIMGLTAFAAEEGDVISVDKLADLAPGTYELDTKLSCFVSAMGGIEFGAPLLKGTVLTVKADGTAAMTMSFGTSSLVIYGQTANTYVGTGRFLSNEVIPAFMGILEGENWVEGTYTTSETVTATPSYPNYDDEGNAKPVAIVDSITVPVKEKADSYSVALTVDSNFMGMQFGKDSKYDGTLTVDWAKTKVLSFAKTYEDTLESGKYAVDISWSAMAGMFSPVLELDAKADTFKVYNKTAPETAKGTGTITFDPSTGEYTLVYDNGNETTFTYDAEKDEITFTSALCYGIASFNRLDEETEEFIPYTGSLMEEENAGTDNPGTDGTPDKDENMGGTDSDKDPVTDDTESDKDNTEADKKDDVTADTDKKDEVTADKEVKTGDNSALLFYAAAAMAALGTAVVIRKREISK